MKRAIFMAAMAVALAGLPWLVDEPDLHTIAFSLDQCIRDERRPMNDIGHRAGVYITQQVGDAVHHRPGRIGSRRKHLARSHDAPFAGEYEVGERPTNVHRNPQMSRCRRLLDHNAGRRALSGDLFVSR